MGKVADQKRRERELLENSRPKREKTLADLAGGEESDNFLLLHKIEFDHRSLMKGGKDLSDFLDKNLLGYYHIDYVHCTIYFDNKEDHAIILGYCTAYQIV
jgi:hypothetical protein